MKLRTEIKAPVFPFQIGYTDHIMSLGSCFATHMASKLALLKYHITTNPTGITFNPQSILTCIKRVKSPDTLLVAPLNHHNGLWSHPDFHSSFSHPDKDLFLKRATKSLNTAGEHLSQSKIIIITIGTSFVFRSNDTGQIVNNCHKLPPTTFTRELLSPSAITDILQELYTLILSLALPDAQLLLTLSPVRHTKNGLTPNLLSKANALVAIHNLVSQHQDCHYFPAYEIMMDDLRDYRFYKEDLIHPNSLATDYIFDLFEQSLLNPREKDLRKKIIQLNNNANHKALFPESKQHQAFLLKLKEDTDRLYKVHPYLAE